MARWLIAAALLCGPAAADEVYLQILGIAQDAGYPQANCYEPHCMRAWQDTRLRRTASSIAVVDTRTGNKYLLDATPDIREQLYRLNLSAPDGRYTLAGIFLTHAHIGHYTGLMHFGHEASGSSDVPVYAMPRMRDFLASNGPWDQLVNYGNIVLRPLADGDAVILADDLEITPFLVPHRDEYSDTRHRQVAALEYRYPNVGALSRLRTARRDLLRRRRVAGTGHERDPAPVRHREHGAAWRPD